MGGAKAPTGIAESVGALAPPTVPAEALAPPTVPRVRLRRDWSGRFFLRIRATLFADGVGNLGDGMGGGGGRCADFMNGPVGVVGARYALGHEAFGGLHLGVLQPGAGLLLLWLAGCATSSPDMISRNDAQRMATVLDAVVRELACKGEHRGNAPGHAHSIPGVWDSDNGPIAGTPCSWCTAWKIARELLDAEAIRTRAEKETK